MAKTFLRSGKLDAVLALGENGQPVYASALQLRETLRLRKQQKIADCLAIPQPNDTGDRIDWYAPFSGKVKSWLAASDSERASAMTLLETCQISIDEISQRAQSAEKAAMQLFGVLLSNAFQFPDQHYIYLVEGKPVITFWGFVDLDKKSRSDALDCLRDSMQMAPSSILPDPVNIPACAPAAPALLSPKTVPVPELPPAGPVEVMTPSKGRSWLRALWLLPPIVIAGAAAMQLYSPEPESAKPVAAVKQQEVTPQTIMADPVAPAAMMKRTPTLPVAPATPAVTSEPEKPAEIVREKPADAPPETVQAAVTPVAVSNNELIMPPDEVKIGSTKFLNGHWRVTLEVKNLPTGKPPSLKYQIKNGSGTAWIRQGDGINCKADIATGLMSSGNLVINSRYTARCSDGSRYKMPEIVCKAGAGAASCEARYGETIFPMTIIRESK